MGSYGNPKPRALGRFGAARRPRPDGRGQPNRLCFPQQSNHPFATANRGTASSDFSGAECAAFGRNRRSFAGCRDIAWLEWTHLPIACLQQFTPNLPQRRCVRGLAPNRGTAR